MNILVVGSGGREHAIALAVKKSPLCDTLVCAPGPGHGKPRQVRAGGRCRPEGNRRPRRSRKDRPCGHRPRNSAGRWRGG